MWENGQKMRVDEWTDKIVDKKMHELMNERILITERMDNWMGG